MIGRLNLSCLPFVTELIVNNCCLLVCLVFITILCVVSRTQIVICHSQSLQVILSWQSNRIHPLFPVFSSAIECIPLLDSGLVLVDVTPHDLIIQHMLLRSSSDSHRIQCSGPLSFSSPSMTCLGLFILQIQVRLLPLQPR